MVAIKQAPTVLLVLILGLLVGYFGTLPLPVVVATSLLVPCLLLIRSAWPVVPVMMAVLIPSQIVPELRFTTPVGSVSVTLLAVTVIAVLCVIGLQRETFGELKPLLTRWVAFVVVSLIPLALSADKLAAIRYLLGLHAGSLGLLLCTYRTSLTVAHNSLKVVAGLGVMVGSLAVVENISGWNPYLSLYDSAAHHDLYVAAGLLWRSSSTVGNSLVLGGFFLLCLPVTLYMLARGEHRSLSMGATAVLLAGIIASASRSCIILAPLILLMFIRTARKKKDAATAQALSLFLGVAALAGLGFLARSSSVTAWTNRLLFNDGYVSYTHRSSAYLAALDILVHNPLGIGIGSFKRAFDANVLSHSGLAVGTLDNGFLDMAVTMGFAGLICYVALVFNTAKLRDFTSSFDLCAAAATLIAFAGLTMVFDTEYFEVTWLTFWAVQGLFKRISQP